MSFNSFDEFVDSMTRGNEVLFEYCRSKYTCTPWWKGNDIVGCVIGRIYADSFEFVEFEALENYQLQGEKFKNIFSKIVIIDRVL